MGELDRTASDKNERRSALVLIVGGVASAFGVAACCALPILLATAGIGTAWLTGIAMVSLPYRNTLMIVSLVSLLVSAGLLWRIQRGAGRCGPGAVRTPKWLRLSLLAGLLIGAGLLVAGYMYV
ncbi:MAG: mercuric reductase [Sphingomonadales bacterium]|nr:mercuric reductase [Sphingomonadaceae bacterium]MBS3931111.1 mercuric reductase [Sphingomonadales bacterium]